MTTPNPYGSDLAVEFQANGSADIDPTCREVSGLGVLVQSVIMRQTTPLGSVIGAPEDCMDLRQLISQGLNPSQVQQIGPAIRQQLLRDQRVIGAVVSASYNLATATLTIAEKIQPSAGPTFTLTIAVSKVTLQLLLNGQPLGGNT
jgi:hypothetical protein